MAMCGPCAEAGFTNVVAQYKEIPKGASYDGKYHPPLCFYHKTGVVPPYIKKMQKLDTQAPHRPGIDKVDEETEDSVAAVVEVTSVVQSTRKSDTPKWTALLTDCAKLKVGEEKRIKLPIDSTVQQFRGIIRNSTITGQSCWTITQNYPDRDTYNVKNIGKWDTFDKVEAKQLKDEGLSNKQVATRLGVDKKRIQEVTSDRAEDDSYQFKPQERNKHLRKNDILLAPVLLLEEYNRKYGELGKKKMAQTTLDMWNRVENLPLNSVLILPMKEGESTNKARSRYSNLLARCIRDFKPNFRVRMIGVQEHHHVVLYKTKESK